MYKDISASLLLASLFNFILGECQYSPEPPDSQERYYWLKQTSKEEPSERQLMDYLGFIALFIAFSLQFSLFFIYLVERFYFTHTKNKLELHQAIKKKDLNCIRSLLENGADIFEVDSEGNTPLHLAIWYVETDVIRLLLARGADITQRNLNGKTPITQVDNKGNTPLHWAVWHGEINVIRLLLVGGANIAQRNFKGKTPITQVDNKGNTPLHRAVRAANIELITLLVKHGADIAQINHKWETPITQADVEGNTPLHWAVRDANIKLIAFLLDNSANPNQKNHQGQTPFNLIPEDRSDIKKLFLEKLLWGTGQVSVEENLEQPHNKNQLAAANEVARKQEGCYYADNPKFSPTFYHRRHHRRY